MFLKTHKRKECYGCFACADICPKDAILLATDKDGYFYPEVDTEKCIGCNRCYNVCPASIHKEEFRNPINCFAGKVIDEEDFNKSSSGGAFKVIVNACIEYYSKTFEKFFCAGCKFDEDFNVIHDVVEIIDRDSVDVFSKSKYVNSNPKGVFKKCKKILSDENNFLIFSGTPCQNAALKKYLNKNYSNLLCVDLICRGAPSQKIFSDYVKYLEKKYNSKLKEYQFKTKEQLDNGTYYTRSARYSFMNGITVKLSRLEDDYLKLFYDEVYQKRPSCESCKFRKESRVSDITIGDAWRIDQIYNEVIPTKGISAVIFVSEKSLVLEKLIREKMFVYEVDYDFLVNNNDALRG